MPKQISYHGILCYEVLAGNFGELVLIQGF
jgi:hypothetical protein